MRGMMTEKQKKLGVGDVNHVIEQLSAGAAIAVQDRFSDAPKYRLDHRWMTAALWERVEHLVRWNKETKRYVLKTQEWREEQARLLAERNEVLAKRDQEPASELASLRRQVSTLREALRELLRVDDDWHGAVNSEMAAARHAARAALAACDD